MNPNLQIARPLAVAIAAGAIAALAVCPRSGAQTLADYPFIEWRVAADILEPTAPDPVYIGELRAEQDSYANRSATVAYRFFANGDIERAQRLVVDYADAAGIASQGNMSLYVNSYSDKLLIEEAYVTSADGRVTIVDPDTVQVLIQDDGGVFSNDHTVVIPWPMLAPGAVSTLRYRLLTRGDRLAAPWSRISFPQSFAPTREYELLASWEQGVSRPIIRSDAEQLRCEETPLLIRCTARDIAPAPVDGDVNYLDELGHVVIAEAAEWSEIAELLRGYVMNSWTADEEVAAVVERVLEGADTEMDRIRALHAFVAEQIRYVGIETGVNGVVPRDTGLVLSRRYGDCKDKTALFLQMAEIAGLSAYPLVVSSNRKNADRLITPGLVYFDHMVACIETAEGDDVCIDLTDPYTPTSATPSLLSAAVALPLREGTTAVESLAQSSVAWMLNVSSDIVFDGSAVRETERRVYGPGYSGLMRATLAGLNRTEVARWAREQYEGIFGTDVPIQFEVQGLADLQAPFVIESSASFDNAIVPGQPLNYEHHLGWLADLASSFYSENQHYDYRLTGFAHRETTTFVLGEWDLVAPGAAIQFDSEFGQMGRRYEIDVGTVRVETLLIVPSRVIPQEDIERFNRFLDTVIENSIVRFRARP